MIHPRKSFERFCLRHRNKGIPNLMLYLTIGSAIVYFFDMTAGDGGLGQLLNFNYWEICQGQVWRLFTFALVPVYENPFLTLISLYCTYSLGRAVESSWGTLRFTLYYLVGIVLLDIYGMFCGYYSPVHSIYLNLSLLLAYATLYTDTQFLIFFIIPIKAWILATFYLIVMIYELIEYPFPYNLAYAVAFLNYFLFFGMDVFNLLPAFLRAKLQRKPKASRPQATGTSQPTQKGNVVQFKIQTAKIPANKVKDKGNYNHKCAVCGRTDVSHPNLEFRYCSRCKGYHCYCEDHIGNHTHVE